MARHTARSGSVTFNDWCMSPKQSQNQKERQQHGRQKRLRVYTEASTRARGIEHATATSNLPLSLALRWWIEWYSVFSVDDRYCDLNWTVRRTISSCYFLSSIAWHNQLRNISVYYGPVLVSITRKSWKTEWTRRQRLTIIKTCARRRCWPWAHVNSRSR